MTPENLPSALLLRLPVLVAIGLGYGSVMATVQQRRMSERVTRTTLVECSPVLAYC